MHIPDGFIDGATSGGAAAIAAGAVAVSLRQAGRALEERQAPLLGLVAAFVFAVQMVNFPVASGTSGHVLGAVMAGVLVGPFAGVVCMTVVLGVQALLFADGGLTALGLNLVNSALVAGLGGYAVFLVLRRMAPPSHGGVAAASGIAAGLSVVLAALGFSVEYAIGGTGGAPVGSVVTAMVGVHALIGVGEGLITATVVRTVLASRPDIVHGAPPRIARSATTSVALAAGGGG